MPARFIGNQAIQTPSPHLDLGEGHFEVTIGAESVTVVEGGVHHAAVDAQNRPVDIKLEVIQ